MSNTLTATRHIVHRTRGQSHGPIARLVSPGDLGEMLKPFVFLDIFGAADSSKAPFGLHPHSGIATVTVFTDGDVKFDDGEGHSGFIEYGGLEWMRAGRGVWHGREISQGRSRGVKGFQLWLALPADVELAPQESQYLEASAIPEVGPARLVIGSYGGAQSPVRAPDGINYLMVTLAAGETWRYETPAGHTVGWFAVAEGEITFDTPMHRGDLAILDRSDGAIELRSTGTEEAKFVLGTAVPHPHELHLGYYSVHTSPAALAAGEAHIKLLHERLIEHQELATREADGSVPVLR